MEVRYKISGTCWLCQSINGGKWVPVTKLTTQQMNDVENTMSKMSELVYDIQEDLAAGILSFKAIAEKYDVPLSWVMEVANEYAL